MEKQRNSKIALRCLAALVACAVLVAFALPAWAEEAPVVSVIEIKGLKRIDEGSVRARITHSTGEPLSSDKVQEDIQEIYKMGYFDDVKVEVEPFEGGVKLLYVVREKPVITRVEFQGNKKLDDDKLSADLTINTGSIADTVLIQQNADAIRAQYAAKGYSQAEVVPVVRRVGDAQAVLTFQINEGGKVKVRKVIVEGNKKISTGKIKDAMKTGKWGLFSFISKKGYYEKNRLDADVESVRDLYFDNGYIQAVVKEPEVEMVKDGLVIKIKVSEGEQFKISSIGFSGNTVFTEKELREKLSSQAGKTFSKAKLQKDVGQFTDMYGEKGYAATNVLPDVAPDEASRQAGINFRISEGEIYKVGEVHIAGNIRTKDKVIRREVRLNEGDTYNSKLLKRSYQRISNTQYFEDVKLVPRLKHREKVVDLDIDVKERKTGALSVGAGYSSIDRVMGMLEFSQSNFRGSGQKVNLKAELGSVASNYSLSFTDPWFLDYPVAFSASLYNTKREFVDYSRKATGLSLGLGKELKEYWGAGVLYELEKAEITDVGATASTTILEQRGDRITSSITPSISRDSRDNNLDTHTGSRNTASTTYAGLGGDNKFFRVLLDSQWFLPTTERTTLAFRGRYGHITGLSGEKVPLYERFYVGGIHTIRGLDFGQAGPRDETGDVIGGLNKVIFNAEFIFPIIESMKLKGVTFFDAGSAYDSKLDDLRYTTGAGVRWISPVGPIRLEWGYNLDPEPGESQSRWEFAVGAFF